ncbi:RHS repeat-associated core domain-containing protein [Hafnia paralvei]|uniref:RHS repeat-associated core domain-containing protein n=1 Tax=Hafnia paralvei TaxID=546367 RepID=UPI0029DB5B6F|nr:RHS repeat-associated core domain-containing protein [Hafnia paralvei]MDX6841745.1 RHS repeat-associated core domain-containing protein [Hafnia paralvei]
MQQCKRTTGNRLTLLGSHHYRYDEYGNCIQDAHSKDQTVVIHYRWNGEHRLVGMTRIHRGKEVASFTYDYDCFGRRIRKHNVLTGETRLFFWQDDRLVAECDEKLACPGGHPTAFGSAPHSDATNCRAYIYEPSADGRHSFRPLAMIAGRDKNTALYYYLNDHLGTPQELVTARGDIVWSAVFYSYGQMRFTLADDVPQPLRFQGQYYDEESGLSYNRYRYYDDCALRYLSPDPIGLTGGINAYAYVMDPLGLVDPLGLSARRECVGGTPSKSSKTGREVIERMRNEGKVRGEGENIEFQASDDHWYPLREADMAHKTDAVIWWNQTGRNLGAKSEEVRKWMLDSNNYYLDHFSINRSAGAKLGLVYLSAIK